MEEQPQPQQLQQQQQQQQHPLDTSTSSWSTAVSMQRREELLAKRRKEIFGDCALIEIIHLHDCLRGALKALETDVNDLSKVVSGTDDIGTTEAATTASLRKNELSMIIDLERRVAGRFKVIWSVFKSHSEAEDEFIWPALNVKSQGEVGGSPKNSPKYHPTGFASREDKDRDDTNLIGEENKDNTVHLEQEEYEEDHADEERMFSEMDSILTNLREVLVVDGEKFSATLNKTVITNRARMLQEHTRQLSQHLMAHLEKEETQCMPLVIKYLSKEEIHELVGNIMGKRSADTIAQIMTMAVQNLDVDNREEMVKYMKQSMAGTFFDRWLTMSGWNGSLDAPELSDRTEERSGHLKVSQPSTEAAAFAAADLPLNDERKRAAVPLDGVDDAQVDNNKRMRVDDDRDDIISQVTEPSMAMDFVFPSSQSPNVVSSKTGQAELEKFIRAIASNPSLTPAQKNTTIQGLRDSVWKSNQRQKDLILGPPTVVNVALSTGPEEKSQATERIVQSTNTRQKTPPSMYFAKSKSGKVELVWAGDPASTMCLAVPLFSSAELAPTHHDGAAGTVLGCPHYARACKLRHPLSGRLYSCRLCCEQVRDMPMKDKDEPLDRYAVTEVMCMKCNALQPAEDRCINSECESRGKPFARYFCRICHLYDDGSRPIFHCPYCNACRLGLGLGIDFRHCMRCNACVSLTDTEHHCIPQSLQGSCPICRETLFESTEPLRGLKCGHVMHLACFTEYKRGLAYTCPLCKQSMEDMKDYFALLDTAIRMQPMPSAYLATFSNILCQDCGETGRTPYHFVGQKCPSCASYNTRELGRVHESPISPQHPTA